jgi:phosphate acetyltransferase
VSSIYIASAEGGTGKSTIALGLLHLLAASAARVGVFKPIVRSTDEPDDLLDLLLEHATATFDDHGQVRGVTYERVVEDPEAALGEIVARYHELARQCDAVVVIGSDYTGVFNPTALTFNARIAANLGAPVLLALNGHDRNH